MLLRLFSSEFRPQMHVDRKNILVMGLINLFTDYIYEIFFSRFRFCSIGPDCFDNMNLLLRLGLLVSVIAKPRRGCGNHEE